MHGYITFINFGYILHEIYAVSCKREERHREISWPRISLGKSLSLK